MTNEPAGVDTNDIQTGHLVTMKHIRACKMCSKGTRAFFEKHGFDWGDFLRQGIDAQTLANTGDAMAIQVAVAAGLEIN